MSYRKEYLLVFTAEFRNIETLHCSGPIIQHCRLKCKVCNKIFQCGLSPTQHTCEVYGVIEIDVFDNRTRYLTARRHFHVPVVSVSIYSTIPVAIFECVLGGEWFVTTQTDDTERIGFSVADQIEAKLYFNYEMRDMDGSRMCYLKEYDKVVSGVDGLGYWYSIDKFKYIIKEHNPDEERYHDQDSDEEHGDTDDESDEEEGKTAEESDKGEGEGEGDTDDGDDDESDVGEPDEESDEREGEGDTDDGDDDESNAGEPDEESDQGEGEGDTDDGDDDESDAGESDEESDQVSDDESDAGEMKTDQESDDQSDLDDDD